MMMNMFFFFFVFGVKIIDVFQLIRLKINFIRNM